MITPPYPLELFRDDFLSPDYDKWTESGTGSVSISGGQLTMDSANGAISVASVASYDLTSSYAAIQLVSIANDEAYGFLFVVGDFHWKAVGDDLQVQYSNGNFSELLNVNLPVYLKIREQSGTIYYDYSSDGTTWQNFTTETINADVSSVAVNITIDSSPVTSTVVFSNFNT